jgi:hemolysin III
MMSSKFREPISGLTHLIGAALSLIGLIVLIFSSAHNRGVLHLVVFTIFGISLILLYSASTIYHLVTISEKAIRVLRRLDHAMIYVLIAGTYTPVCILALKGRLGWGLLISIWSLAALGIILKMFWFEAPRWLYTSFYVFMGWISVFVVAPLTRVVPFRGIGWLFAGGVLYTIGAAIYGTKWPKINSKLFGFHEIFHLFVMAGSFCHYWLMLRYIMNI